MTPKQKAEDLYAKYEDVNHMFHKYNNVDDIINHAKESALIAVDEIIKALPPFQYGLEFVAKIEFWKNVKNEIENL